MEVVDITILSKRKPCRHCGKPYSTGELACGCFGDDKNSHRLDLCPFCGTPRKLPVNN